MARDHLAIPGPSAASACVFSISGDIITKSGIVWGQVILEDYYVCGTGGARRGDGDGSNIEIYYNELDCYD
jgi:hypothetical protein